MGTLVAVLLTGQAAMKLPSRLDSSAVVGETPCLISVIQFLYSLSQQPFWVLFVCQGR